MSQTPERQFRHDPYVRPDLADTAGLLVSAEPEERSLLRHLLRGFRWTLHEARNCREAVRTLLRFSIPLVLCDCALPDGTWQDLLNHAALLQRPPLVVVMLHEADDILWADVLASGGFDVLMKPLCQSEVAHVVQSALLRLNSALDRGRARSAGA